MKRALIALIVVVPAVGAGFYLSTQQDNAQYSGYDAMKKAGLFDDGWLPSSLPVSTQDFQSSFNEENRKGMASFRYRVGDTESMDRQCILLGSDAQGRRYGCDTATATIQVQLRADGTGVLVSDPKPSLSR